MSHATDAALVRIELATVSKSSDRPVHTVTNSTYRDTVYGERTTKLCL